MAKQTKEKSVAKVQTTAESEQLDITICDIQSVSIEHLIYTIRGVQVMLDRDIALLYGVETKRLNEQVKRNIERFPKKVSDLCPVVFGNSINIDIFTE